MPTEKTIEARLRRRARAQHLLLTKSRGAHWGGPYFISDDNKWLLSSEHGMTLEDVEQWLMTD